jgi:glycosyltransferase involved in cell wall biosynthesis
VAIVLDAEEVAGAEVYVSWLVEELHDAVEFVAVVGDRAPRELRALLGDAGARVVGVRGLRRYARPPAVPRLLRALRAVRPDVVHVNVTDPGDSTASLAAARLVPFPSVATLHLAIPGRARWRELVTSAALVGVDRVVSVSEAVASYVRARGVQTVVVQNGVRAPEPAADPRGALGMPADAFVVGGIGRLHEQKGWDVLCDAAARVRASREDAAFVVVGGGEGRSALVARARRAGVQLAGYRPGASAYVHGFDVLAVPSRYEGFGLVAVEAMLSGVPVVASDVGGLPSVVGDAGLLVPPEDPAALADAILRLGADAGLRERLVAQGRERALERFGSERMARETLAVYRTLAPGTFAPA